MVLLMRYALYAVEVLHQTSDCLCCEYLSAHLEEVRNMVVKEEDPTLARVSHLACTWQSRCTIIDFDTSMPLEPENFLPNLTLNLRVTIFMSGSFALAEMERASPPAVMLGEAPNGKLRLTIRVAG